MKTLRGNHAAFVSEEARKAIYNENRFRKKFLKKPDKINRTL